MSQESKDAPYNEFLDSPLYAGLKAVGGLFRRKKMDEGKKAKAAPVGPENDDYSRFRSFDDKLVRFFRIFANISAVALIVIMLLAFVDVVGCKLKAAGVMWAHGINNNNNMIQYFHIPLVFLSAACVTLDQGHTRIDLICGKFPAWLEKGFMFLGHILGAAISFFVVYRSVAVTLVSQLEHHTRIADTSTSWFAWPFTVCHIVGFFLLGLSFVWSMVRMIRFWKYPGVNAYYVMHPEKAMGPGEGMEAPTEDNAPAESEGKEVTQ